MLSARSLVIAGMLALTSSISAQPIAVVSGRVLLGTDGQPAQGITLHIENHLGRTGDSTVSDDDGRFVLPVLAGGPGDYTVWATGIGLEGFAPGVLVSSGKRSEVNIFLVPENCLCEFPGWWEVPLVSRGPYASRFSYPNERAYAHSWWLGTILR